MGLPLPEQAVVNDCSNSVGFEGFEKRLEIEFYPPKSNLDARGLRDISRSELDELLSAAGCTIVSELSNSHFDSYVLSESSLFVYPFMVVLKTCGTTKLLAAVPYLLRYASRSYMKVKCCKYSRGTFFFPKEQPYPHENFSQEVAFLDRYFGHLNRDFHVLGDDSGNLKWHIYSASAVLNEVQIDIEPVYTVEMCMTRLDKNMASKFFKNTNCTAMKMTQSSGISNLIPGSQICDFAFDPCGYSMNGIDGTCFSTIHVTPEDGFSYASFEIMGFDTQKVNLKVLVDKVIPCFKPSAFSLSLHVTGPDKAGICGEYIDLPNYVCDGTSNESLPGGAVVYKTFKNQSVWDEFVIIPAAV